jgi:hypothetical protein
VEASELMGRTTTPERAACLPLSTNSQQQMSAQPDKYLAVLKASYDYTPQSDDEIQISENQILYLVERVDEEWVLLLLPP